MKKRTKTILLSIGVVVILSFIVFAGRIFVEIIKVSEEAKNPILVTDINARDKDMLVKKWQKLEEYEKDGEYKLAIEQIDWLLARKVPGAPELFERKERLEKLLLQKK